jgi:hypothetical protein
LLLGESRLQKPVEMPYEIITLEPSRMNRGGPAPF